MLNRLKKEDKGGNGDFVRGLSVGRGRGRKIVDKKKILNLIVK